MDNITIIALASIAIAGLTTAIGCVAPALGEGRGLTRRSDFARATTRCGRYHHPHPFRWPGHGRIAGHLLLRHFYDFAIRESILESCPDEGGRRLTPC